MQNVKPTNQFAKFLYSWIWLKKDTPETQFSEPWFSELLDLMNKLQLPFSYFTLVKWLNLVNKKGLKTMFTKSRIGCMIDNAYLVWCGVSSKAKYLLSWKTIEK